VWQRLVCFAYRASQPADPEAESVTVTLRHQYTTAQLAALDAMELAATELLRGHSDQHQVEHDATEVATLAVQEQLDRASLDLSIALLDHPLKGDLFESVLVGFLAVLGVNAENRTFRDPYGYTSYLSGLVKIAQMLVVQRAVQMAEDGQVAHPADALDDMRERFLLPGVATPFAWVIRLRTFGKRIQNTTTSLGYIYWSDDQETLSYKELQLTMPGLRRFIRVQVELAQYELEQLFLIHDEEAREAIIPQLNLNQLTDDPTNNKRGWNFLQDPRNHAVLSTTGQRWLLDRVLTVDWLRAEWVEVRPSDSQMVWHASVVDHYLQQVDQFLERLLLLIHLTAGQPARATELLSLRHSNTVCGRHRNIFIEHGLVSTVTTYHKGYSMTNSTKIIHRYLPAEVSELVVYYLWLILPFARAIQRLAYGSGSWGGPRSPFLWASGQGSWDGSRLRAVLQREAHTYLQTKLNVISWRHAAIAISRAHLQCGGFKRDYGADDNLIDHQASHGSWAAGTVYARGLQEAPGHIEARRKQYRAISREWHEFLGFKTGLGPRKRKLQVQECNHNEFSDPKRQREYVIVNMWE
jgi:hypothetical protein